jgi:hypothetical protein
MITLADEAPSGAGLAIVGAILLAFFALVVGGIVLIAVLLVRRNRRKHPPGPPAAGWPGATPQESTDPG